MGKVSLILEGWKNHLFPAEHLKEFIDTTSKERLEICISCDRNSTPNTIKTFSRCKECGCPLQQKSKSLKSECPLKKWEAVATPDEESEINLGIKNGKHSE